MKNSIHIRPAQTQDSHRMIHIHFAAVQQISTDFYSSELLQAWSPTPNTKRYEWMHNLIESKSRLVLVAVRENELCAFAICDVNNGFIQALYVEPQFTGQGIGKQLLQAVEEEIIQSGVTMAHLNASNNALEFYKSAEYLVVRPATQTLSDGSEMACVEMKKILTT